MGNCNIFVLDILKMTIFFLGDAAADADTSDAESSSTEGKAGEAIKTLLQEKISKLRRLC